MTAADCVYIVHPQTSTLMLLQTFWLCFHQHWLHWGSASMVCVWWFLEHKLINVLRGHRLEHKLINVLRGHRLHYLCGCTALHAFALGVIRYGAAQLLVQQHLTSRQPLQWCICHRGGGALRSVIMQPCPLRNLWKLHIDMQYSQVPRGDGTQVANGVGVAYW
jgi:hypothetical protein